MIESQVSDWTLARCWGTDTPDAFRINSAVATVRRLVAATPSVLPSLTTVIEVQRITGPRTVYGLLGAIYKPSTSTELVIEFPVCPTIRTIVSPLLSDEDPSVGLPDWLASGIADTAADYAVRLSPRAGHLLFSFAAYTNLGSNVSIFKVLVKCVLDASLSGIEITTPDLLAELVRKHL